ncbi:hypothetical protein [Roseiconus lacunae]|uniref:Uncharacterized protein n=1 Tax=Roseiconus lacunae TaxID=2605694 RepID=A0ABT7PPF9_9BACT|nr:hypothetical protein [Roseiconus lacunae]MDM4018191.1 hypothetical protein [Roseiconus lacunae]
MTSDSKNLLVRKLFLAVGLGFVSRVKNLPFADIRHSLCNASNPVDQQERSPFWELQFLESMSDDEALCRVIPTNATLWCSLQTEDEFTS